MRVLQQNIKNWHVRSFLYWSLVILFSILLQVALSPPLCAQRPPGANEVAVYEHINYVGNQEIFALEPGMRQKLVRWLPNTVANKISSIQVGANVGVAFYNNQNFLGPGNATIQSINNLSLTPEYHDKISSLIIFPKEWAGPMGVLITGKFWIPSQYGGSQIGIQLGKFFPAPEKMTDRITYYPEIGYELQNNNIEAYVWPSFMHPVFQQVFIKLCEQKNYGGKCITIPGPLGGKNIQQYFKLSDYQFENKVASLQVIHNYPVSVKQPIPARTPIRTPPTPIQMQKAPPPIAANAVAVWEHINYQGNHETYTLEPGMRQKLVPLLPTTVRNKISSIQVGANVGVHAWIVENFRGITGAATLPKGAEGLLTRESIDNLSGDTIPHTPLYNDRIQSLIIFPKEWGAPMGAVWTMVAQFHNQKMVSCDYYPAPEKMTDRIAYFPKAHHVDGIATKVQILIGPDTQHPISKEVRVKLCDKENFGGKCITMPPASGKLYSGNAFQLSDYGFYNKVLSLQVVHTSVRQPTSARTPIRTPVERMPVQKR